MRPDFDYDGIPFYGGDPSMLDESFVEGGNSPEEQDGDGDIAEFAREARAMAAMSGEPFDKEFDAALRHIEQGADPDDVLGDMDERAITDADDREA